MKSFVTKMKCQVTSELTRKVMISRETKVPSYKEICGGEKTRVYIGYNNDPFYEMTVKDNQLLRDPSQSGLKLRGSRPWISHNWEVLQVFFRAHNIQPNWIHADQIIGHYDEEQGGWTGLVGKVRKPL